MPSTAISQSMWQATAPTVATVILVGDNRLAAALRRDLAHEPGIAICHHRSIGECIADPSALQARLVVALSRQWQPTFDRAIQRWCWEHQLAFLRVGIWQHEAVIGPLTVPGISGCLECAERRRFRSFAYTIKNQMAFLKRCEDESYLATRPPNPWASDAVINAISALASIEIRTFVASGSPRMGSNTVRFTHLLSFTSSRHTFLPDSLCPLCSTPIDDSAEQAVICFKPRFRRPGSYRLRSLDDELEELEARYVDAREGIMPPLADSLRAGSFATSRTSNVEYPHSFLAVTCGSYTPSFRSSRAGAIAEALERYCGHFPRAKRTVVYGSYRQHCDHAIDPEQFGIYTHEQYVQHADRNDYYKCAEYTPDLEYSWVWGYSLSMQKPLLIPEQFVYYSVKDLRPEEGHFIRETSNGCALGASIEEAILQGLAEAIERDGFMIAWYSRARLARVDPHSTRDPAIRLAIERVERMTGFNFFFFDATTDFGFPIIVCFGVNPRDEAPKMMCGAGAHWDPDRALHTAFYEVASAIPGRIPYPVRDLEHGRKLLADHSLVISIHDHFMIGEMPETAQHVSFLFQAQPLQPLAERFAAQYANPPSQNLTEDLTRLLDRIFARGYDVLVVDQTAPEVGMSNLHCVRVLVPGLIPISFNHNLRRTRGLSRLYRLPQELGYVDHILTEAELNSYPHFFP